MSVETFDVQEPVVLTASAQTHLLAKVRQSGAAAIRLGLKKSGCTGYMYVLEEVQAPDADDVNITTDNGLCFLVAADAVPVVRGTELDYVQEGINRVLRFNNPNVTVACGCGESFDVD
jgi:iron-sulfur cluster assembly accessory protein